MLLHTDIPTRTQVDRLIETRHDGCVSIYLRTDPASPGDRERLEFESLAADAVSQLQKQGASPVALDAVQEHLAGLADDPGSWEYLARSLAVLATADSLTTFRLPNELTARVQVADRFLVKPLLRTLTFPQLAYVLALGQNSVRLLEVLPDAPPYEVRVPDLPRDVVDALGVPSVRGRGHWGRMGGTEGQKVRLGQYARHVDRALRPILGDEVPLVLAANEPLASIYRSASTYPHLAPTALPGNAETTTDAVLAARARTVLDELYAARLRAVRALFEERNGQGRAAYDLAEVARTATYGMVDTVLVDIDDATTGSVDDGGEVGFTDDLSAYGLVDEIARRVWISGGKVLAVRRPDVPGGGPVAAILRYSPWARRPVAG